METYSPLRYPGGKSKLANFMKNIFRFNNLANITYVEPFAGGAGIAIDLLINGYVNEIIINDFDRSIFAFWYAIINHTDTFIEKIKTSPLTVDYWLAQKKIQAQKDTVNLFSLGFSTFYLNRTNRSGIIKGGIIGGLDQSGNYKMDARFNKNKLIKKIQLIASFKNRIKLFNADANDLIHQLVKEYQPGNLFLYLDPPYYKKGPGLYVNNYKHEDHFFLSTFVYHYLQNFNWIITYDNVEAIKELYTEYSSFQFELNYSAAKASKGTEVMFYNKLSIDTDWINSKKIIAV